MCIKYGHDIWVVGGKQAVCYELHGAWGGAGFYTSKTTNNNSKKSNRKINIKEDILWVG